MAFVHLHNHTEYSLLDGHTHIYDMVKRAADLGMDIMIDFHYSDCRACRSCARCATR